jgi:ribosomal protein S6
MPAKRETQLLERIQRMDGNIKKLRGVIKEQKTEIRELKAFGKRML